MKDATKQAKRPKYFWINLVIIILLTYCISGLFSPFFPFASEKKVNFEDLEFQFKVNQSGDVWTISNTYEPLLLALKTDFGQIINLNSTKFPLIQLRHLICMGVNTYYFLPNGKLQYWAKGPMALDIINGDGKENRIRAGENEGNLTDCEFDRVQFQKLLAVQISEKHPEIYKSCEASSTNGVCELKGRARIFWSVSLLNRPESLVAIYLLSFILSITFIRIIGGRFLPKD